MNLNMVPYLAPMEPLFNRTMTSDLHFHHTIMVSRDSKKATVTVNHIMMEDTNPAIFPQGMWMLIISLIFKSQVMKTDHFSQGVKGI